MTTDQPGDDLAPRVSQYSYRNPELTRAELDSVFDWLAKSRRSDKFDVARLQITQLFLGLENRVLDRFRDYAGGPEYIHKAEAWIAACRQRELTREMCARMTENYGGIPTEMSEAIRALDIGPDVKVIPDYARRMEQDER